MAIERYVLLAKETIIEDISLYLLHSEKKQKAIWKNPERSHDKKIAVYLPKF
jgi:hypothetical protein